MPNPVYDQLRLTGNNPLSVERWNSLVDELERVESTLNRVHLSATDSGRLGIGTLPSRALHIKGSGSLNDDLLIESVTATRYHSGALIFERHRPNAAPLKTGDLTGLLAMRGKHGNEPMGDAGVRSTYRGVAAAGKHQNDLSLYNTVNGREEEMLSLDHRGYLEIKKPLRGNLPGGALEIITNGGNIKIGPMNGQEAHFLTDRDQFYFGKKIAVNSGIFSGRGTQNLSLVTSSGTRLRILGGSGTNKGYVGINTTSPKSRLHVKGMLTLQNSSSNNRGWIKITNGASNAAAKTLLGSMSNNQALIAGVWDEHFYLYWKDKNGRKRRAMIKGGTF